MDEYNVSTKQKQEFYCPVCRRWIATAYLNEDDTIYDSACSSDFIDIYKPCRVCENNIKYIK